MKEKKSKAESTPDWLQGESEVDINVSLSQLEPLQDETRLGHSAVAVALKGLAILELH